MSKTEKIATFKRYRIDTIDSLQGPLVALRLYLESAEQPYSEFAVTPDDAKQIGTQLCDAADRIRPSPVH